MKTLKSISAVGLHDQAFHHELGPVTVFHGQVHTYKTARLAAVKLLLLSHDPGQGKKEGSTYKRAAGDVLRVSGTWSDGTEITKQWARKNGSVKFTGPADPAVPITMLDPERWFREGTAQDRLNYVFGLVDLQALGYSTATIMAALAQAKFPAEVREETARSWAEGFARTAKDYKTAIDNSKGTIQQWTEQLLAKLKGDAKAARETVQRAQGSAQMAVQAGVEGQPPRDTSRELAEAEAELANTSQERAELGQRLKQHTDNEARIAALEEFTAAFGKQVQERDKWNKRAEEAHAWLLNAPARRPDTHGNAAYKADRLKEDIQRIEAAIGANAANQAALLKLKACPTCDAKGTSWRASMKKKMAADTTALQGQRLKLLKEQREAQAEVKQAREARAFNDELDTEAAEKRVAANEASGHLKRLEKDLAGHGPAVAELATRQADRLALKREFDLATQKLPVLDAEIAARQADISRLRAEHDRWTEHQAIEKQQAKARLELRAAQDRAECVGAVLEALSAKQQEMVDAAMKTLLAPANKFTNGFVPGEFTYHESDFGYWYETPTKREWISHTVFSGAEQATAYAGLAIALCQSSPYKLVLLDRLDLDYEHKRALFQRMAKLVKDGTIDQCLATDVTDACLGLEGVTVVEMAKRKPVTA